MGSSRWKEWDREVYTVNAFSWIAKARRGKVKWNGKVIHKVDSKERFKSIGYVSQHPYYHLHLIQCGTKCMNERVNYMENKETK